jgi:hypothetical protein
MENQQTIKLEGMKAPQLKESPELKAARENLEPKAASRYSA